MLVKLFKPNAPDVRCEVLLEALQDVLQKRGKDLPVYSLLGVIRLLEARVIESKNAS